MQSPRIPWEVIERVVGHSCDPSSLCSFSLTCRELLPRSRCLLLSAGVKVRSRDHAFALVDFLQDNPHLKPFITSITVDPNDFPPIPLLRILSNLSNIKFISQAVHAAPPLFFHPFNLACFRIYGSHVQTLQLFRTSFPTPLAFAQLLLAFSSITHLVCEKVDIQMGWDWNEAPLAVAKRRLSEKLCLRSLVSDSTSLNARFSGHFPTYNVNIVGIAMVLLDPNLKLAWSTLETFEITDYVNSKLLTVPRHVPSSTWRQLRSLVLHLSPNYILMNSAVSLLNGVDSTKCKDVTIHFDEGKSFGSVKEDLFASQRDAELERALLKFSQVCVILAIGCPLRSNGNSFWSRELKKRFLALFQRGATFAVKSESRLGPAGHDDGVSALVVSPDNKWIASGYYDSTIILWDTRDGSIAQRWAFPGCLSVYSLAFSPDSHYLAVGGNGPDTAAVLLELSSSAIVVMTLGACNALASHTATSSIATGCAWSPDGTTIAVGSSGMPVQLWSIIYLSVHPNRHRLGWDHTTDSEPTTDYPNVVFSPDGRWLAGASSTHCYVWDIPQYALHNVVQHDQEYPGQGCSSTFSLVFDSGSTRLLSTPGGAYVNVLDVETNEILFVSPIGSTYRAASFSPDGRLVLAALARSVKVWDINSGVEVLELKGHSSETTLWRAQDVRFSPCGNYVASGGDDSRVRLWRVSDGTCVAELCDHEGSVMHVAFSPDGTMLSSGAADGTVVIRHMSEIIPAGSLVEQDL